MGDGRRIVHGAIVTGNDTFTIGGGFASGIGRTWHGPIYEVVALNTKPHDAWIRGFEQDQRIANGAI